MRLILFLVSFLAITTVRESLPSDYLAAVEDFDKWFGYVENYRHALAHRIPLYIPSRQYRPGEWEEWTRLDALHWTSILEHDFERAEQLETAKDKVGTFAPFMLHSFEEPSEPVTIHPQMLCDLATVLDMTEQLLPYLASDVALFCPPTGFPRRSSHFQ